MSESQNILVLVGGNKTPRKRPLQDYPDLYTEFSLEADDSNDAVFFQSTFNNPNTEDKTTDDFDIVGFLPGNGGYSSSKSMDKIAKFFNDHPNADALITDMEYKSAVVASLLTHPGKPGISVPFFVRTKVKSLVKFTPGELGFSSAIQHLKDNGVIIYHIAEPLLRLHLESPSNE